MEFDVFQIVSAINCCIVGKDTHLLLSWTKYYYETHFDWLFMSVTHNIISVFLPSRLCYYNFTSASHHTSFVTWK